MEPDLDILLRQLARGPINVAKTEIGDLAPQHKDATALLARALGLAVRHGGTLHYCAADVSHAEFRVWLERNIQELSSRSKFNEAASADLGTAALHQLRISPARLEEALSFTLHEERVLMRNEGGSEERTMPEEVLTFSPKGASLDLLSADTLCGARTWSWKDARS